MADGDDAELSVGALSASIHQLQSTIAETSISEDKVE